MQIDEAEVREELKSKDFTEISRKTSFVAYRKTEGGGAYRVSIDILDAGEGAGINRYFCLATRENGKSAAANSEPSVKEAIWSVHWYELDD